MTEPKSEKPPLRPAYRMSGIARPVDPAYATNKAVLVLVPLVLVFWVVTSLLDGVAVGEAMQAGFNVTLTVFLTWALTRELSPDDNLAAFIAVGLALAVWPRVGAQSLLILAMALLAARLLNRSTGKPAELGDSVIAMIGFAAGTWLVSWTLGVVGVLALGFDALLPVPGEQQQRRRHLGFAGALALVVVARIIVGIAPLGLPAHSPVFATIAGLCAIAAGLYPRPRSLGDVDAQPLSHLRVRAGLAAGLLATVLVSIDSGIRLQSVASLWVCMLAVPVGLPILALRRRKG
ncbi:hypothetical protein [Enhygromyxa salina]|uniref:Uncharacterized protein n=1 Tax=Enhygromyxa salina TaxID=215803 RepID=A0A2S9XTS4_9BACT|nr:hypothetical protein [Enhygromyxa salina]PRP96243.1 hypothetical protein ENSA7_70570 [Enhygromyxa salina]